MAFFKRTKKEEKHNEAQKPNVNVAAETTINKPTNVAIALYPYVTEKAASSSSHNAYVFKVGKEATKIDVRRAIEKGYKVNVVKVAMINVRPKARRVGRVRGFRPGFKKAIVTLRTGQTIETARA